MLGEGGFVRGAGEKIRGGLVEQAEFVGLDGVEINFGSGAGQRGQARGIDPAPVGQKFQTDEKGIAGEGRGAGIGGVAVAGGAERKNLPDVLAGRGEEGEELVGGGTEIADAAGRG